MNTAIAIVVMVFVGAVLVRMYKENKKRWTDKDR